jgi:hypothetical protein
LTNKHFLFATVVGEKCEAEFYPAKRNNKVLACNAWIPLNPLLKELDPNLL